MPNPIHLGAFRDLEPALATAIIQHKTQHSPLAPLQIIVPTRLLGLHLQRALARARPAGHANLRFQTLTDLLPPGRLAPPLGLELLCRQLAPAGHFAPVRETRGFASALLGTFTDLKEAGLQPVAFAKSAPHKELATAYAAFCDWLTAHDFATEANLFLQSSIIHHQSPILLYGFYDLNHAQRTFIERLAPAAIFFPSESDYAQPLLQWFQSLGYRPQPITPPLRHSITPSILSCPGETAEVREAVRQILAWLRDNPDRTFNDVAILCRSREQYDAILRDTLTHLGIPAYFRGGRPLAEHHDAKLLRLLLDVVRTDFSRASVLELACHRGPNSRWDVESIDLGIVSGRDQWRARLRSPVASPGLRQFVEKLFAIGEPIPATGKWSAFADAVHAAYRQLDGAHPPVLATLDALAELDPFQSPVTFATFADFCARALDSAREQPAAFQGGGIFVSDVMGARGLSFPFVVLLGLFEKSFPRVVREDPLLPDRERARVSPHLPRKLAGHDEERLLFALATGVATDQLVLSYPRLEAGTARPRMPSALLLDHTGAANYKELAKQTRAVPLVPIRLVDLPVEERELDLPALTDLRTDPIYLREIGPLLPAGLDAYRQRWQKTDLTGHDGLIESAAAVKLLRDRFGLEKLVTSATALEDFFACPFYYFQKHVLGIKEWEEPEAAAAISALDLGSLYHRILEDFYRAWPDGDLDAIVTACSAEFEQSGVTGYPAVWEIKKQIIREELAAFIQRDRQQLGADWRPAEFEKEFHGLAVAPPVRLRGKIDRLDLSADGRRARIYDYKTGKRPRGMRDDSLAGGEALQLPLYLLAAEQLLKNVTLDSARYLYFTLRGGFQTVRFSRAALADRQAELTDLLQTAADMIRAGTFAQYATPDNCRYCDYRVICGNGILKLYERKSADERMAAFRAIKEEVA